MNSHEAVQLVLSCLDSVMETHGISGVAQLNHETHLLGRGSPLDSVALVDLLLDVEGQVSDSMGTTITLANEQALSRSSSPFRSVQTLADYLVELIAEHGESRSDA